MPTLNLRAAALRQTLMVAAATLVTAAAHAAEPAPLADFTFSEAAAITLNLAANTGTGLAGPGGRWDVAIPGTSTDGAGGLRIRNNGGGGSGTRTSYADFGPIPAAVTEGLVTLYASFSAWNLSGADNNGPTFTLALIEGNDFAMAQFSLTAGATGLTLAGSSDPAGDGGSIAQTAPLAAAGSAAFTVRLSVDLAALSYHLALDNGSGFAALGSASVDSFSAGVNSLRLSLSGDFTLGGQAARGLTVDRLWVTATPVPEPASAVLLLAGFGLLALRRRSAAATAVT